MIKSLVKIFIAAVFGLFIFCSCTEEEVAPKSNNGIDGDPITIKT